MVIYNHNAHPARFFFCLDIISIFKGWPRWAKNSTPSHRFL
jgi:hypothetical protein